jgi:hypothetical protein
MDSATYLYLYIIIFIDLHTTYHLSAMMDSITYLYIYLIIFIDLHTTYHLSAMMICMIDSVTYLYMYIFIIRFIYYLPSVSNDDLHDRFCHALIHVYNHDKIYILLAICQQ